jgi:transketolase
MSPPLISSASALVKRSRRRLLELLYRKRLGHIGGNLSCLDALVVLFHHVLTPSDRFILSKGHAAAALYVVLWTRGELSDEQLETFGDDDTTLPGHPSGAGVPGLLFPTGSLGHGPSLAAGLALAARHQNAGRHVYCFCSDGEWQEGSCWEALTFAVHHRLDNLTIVIDQNGLQAFGSTAEVTSCSDLAPRLEGFGARVVTANGHDVADMQRCFTELAAGCPRVIVLATRKGLGTALENTVASHYLPLTTSQFDAAMGALS